MTPLEDGFTGGCQCGAIRFTVAAGPVRQSVCHCRMCQRATGNAFAPLAEVETARIDWQGSPATWASSSIAERGFCPTCGSPIFFRDITGTTTEFMVGSLADPETYAPAYNYGTESRLGWVARLHAMEDRETEDPGLTSRQVPL